jgi:putative restriction endonuclease
VGDWIVYYEPTKVIGTRGYFAAAKVEAVVADPTTPSMYLAKMAPGTYLPFVAEVPFNLPGGPTESGLLNAAGRLSGRAQSAVRPLSPANFSRIVTIGLADDDLVLPRIAPPLLDQTTPFEIDEQARQEPFEDETARERVLQLISRPVRDRIFRTIVVRAYEQKCAVTGFRFINGGGRAEVDAAHIRPVEADGPDILQNGIALSGTVHWMFDRGLIGFADDMTVLVSRHVNDRDGVDALINPTHRLIAPANADLRPHPRYLAWHRKHVFKT